MSASTHPQIPLTQLNIFLSNGCSLSCRQCSLQLPARNDPGKQYLPAVFLMQAVREAQVLGLESVLLTGCDPFLHAQFTMILEWLERLNLKSIQIESSGQGLTQERAARLAQSGRINISICLDGSDAATHDAIHQAPGQFEAAANALRLLAQAGLQPQVVFTVIRRNAGQVTALVRLAEELGAASVRFNIMRPSTCQVTARSRAAQATPSESLEVAELIALGRRVERELACCTPLRLTFDHPPAFRGLQPSGYIDGLGRCGILNSISVLNNGKYALCGAGQLSNNLILGSVGADPLDRIWFNHTILESLRDGMPDRLKGICERCILKTACLGNCAAENYETTGSFWGPYWFCDAADRAGLFPAGRLVENNW